MLPLSPTLRAQAVYLINEDDTGCIAAGHLKQAADHALTLTPGCGYAGATV